MSPSRQIHVSPGFSLVEVLVSLVVSGILMAMLAMVMGQVVQNDEALRGLTGKTTEAATLRRILHRDLAGIGKPITLHPAGFSFTSSHNHLVSGPLPLDVFWTFQDGVVRRVERLPAMSYASEMVFATGLRGWQVDYFDLKSGAWINGKSGTLPENGVLLSGLCLTLVFADQTQLKIVERIPYVTSF